MSMLYDEPVAILDIFAGNDVAFFSKFPVIAHPNYEVIPNNRQ